MRVGHLLFGAIEEGDLIDSSFSDFLERVLKTFDIHAVGDEVTPWVDAVLEDLVTQGKVERRKEEVVFDNDMSVQKTIFVLYKYIYIIIYLKSF